MYKQCYNSYTVEENFKEYNTLDGPTGMSTVSTSSIECLHVYGTDSNIDLLLPSPTICYFSCTGLMSHCYVNALVPGA